MKAIFTFIFGLLAIVSASAEINSVHCNEDNFIYYQRTTQLPESGSYGSGEIKTYYQAEATLMGNNPNGVGVINYFIEQNTFLPENKITYQTFDPSTHTYPFISKIPLSSGSQEVPFDIYKGVSFKTTGGASIVSQPRFVTIKLESGGTIIVYDDKGTYWRFENCTTH